MAEKRTPFAYYDYNETTEYTPLEYLDKKAMLEEIKNNADILQDDKFLKKASFDEKENKLKLSVEGVDKELEVDLSDLAQDTITKEDLENLLNKESDNN